MSVRKFVLPAVAAGMVATAGLAGAAFAHGDHPAPSTSTPQQPATGPAVFLAAGLNGKNEVPAGDPDGKATAVVRISGDQVSFAVRWQNTAAPRAFHIHQGAAGSNGGIKVDFFGSALPDSAQAVSGSVKVTDPALLSALRTNPNGFYVNLHTSEFPTGAVRAQLHKLNRPVDLNGVLHGSSTSNLQSLADGKQEVPGPKPAGDPNGRTAWLLRTDGDKLSYATVWAGIGAPTNGHVHSGVRGVNGPVVADLFADTDGLPASVTGIAGSATVSAELAGQFARNPKAFYTNLHTAEFSGGAVRGQLAPASSHRQPSAVNAAVINGVQIYHCVKQADGSFAFGQFSVAAVLRGDILHSFARPVAGPPQWIAPDGSAVTGTVVTRTPNGAGNIPELVLDATKAGGNRGLLAGSTQILRVNIAGGVAPAGACDPETRRVATVPYQADYLFLG